MESQRSMHASRLSLAAFCVSACVGLGVSPRLTAGIECPGETLIDFEDLTTGTTYTNGNVFVTGGVMIDVDTFYFSDPACLTRPFNGGSANVLATGLACRAGNALNVNNVNLNFQLLNPVGPLVVHYGEYGGNLNIEINSDCRNFDNFVDINGLTIGGVLVSAVDVGAPGGSCGTLELQGSISDSKSEGKSCTSMT